MEKRKHSKRIYDGGFSLVELSIVLVILGLLTGGILGGQSLIKAAELRAVTTELDAFQTATNTFRQKYFALPGDMRNAHRFWDLLPGATEAGSCPTVGSQDARTCNGDGDGVVRFFGGGGAESRHVWKHLANAGLINGNFSGEYLATQVPGQSGPASKYNNAMWAWGGSYWMYNTGQIEENPLIIGKPGYPGIDTTVDSPIFSGPDAWNIDTKIDDGKPEDGKVQGFSVSGSDCVDTSDSESYALYAESNDACALIFFFM